MSLLYSLVHSLFDGELFGFLSLLSSPAVLAFHLWLRNWDFQPCQATAVGEAAVMVSKAYSHLSKHPTFSFHPSKSVSPELPTEDAIAYFSSHYLHGGFLFTNNNWYFSPNLIVTRTELNIFSPYYMPTRFASLCWPSAFVCLRNYSKSWILPNRSPRLLCV